MPLFVIPDLTRNPGIFDLMQSWMPDRVRHDDQKLGVFGHCPTALQAYAQAEFASIKASFCNGVGSAFEGHFTVDGFLSCNPLIF